MILPDVLNGAAERFPENPAAVFPAAQLTFGLLERRSSKVAARLQRLGVRPGNRVAILYENSPAALAAYWGVLKSGAVSVDISTLAGDATVSEILNEADVAAIALSPVQLRRLTRRGIPSGFPQIVLSEEAALAPASALGLPVQSFEEIYDAEERAEPVAGVSERDVAMVIYTSGTTGRPKGVMLSHLNVISNLISVNSLMNLNEKDSILLAVPLHYIHGRMQLLTHTYLGATVYFSAGFHIPQNVLSELIRYRATGFSGVPYHFKMLLDRSALKTAELPDLRYAVITGGAMSPADLQELVNAIPRAAVHIAYGQTEAAPRITNLPPSEILTRVGSCGQPIPGVKVEILDDTGMPVPTNSVGEVVVSGPNVMAGYVSGDAQSLGMIDAQGRLHTGDLGRMDAEDYLYLAGRKSEMMKIAGERVMPGEIEDVLNSHPSVQEAAVVSTGDAVLGERIVAFVLPATNAWVSSQDLHSHCLKFLPFVRVPREIRILDQLPKTGSGKLDRAALRSLSTENLQGAGLGKSGVHA